MKSYVFIETPPSDHLIPKCRGVHKEIEAPENFWKWTYRARRCWLLKRWPLIREANNGVPFGLAWAKHMNFRHTLTTNSP